MIKLDVVATWKLRQLGCDPLGWINRLLTHNTGHDDNGKSWTSWRQLPGAPPGDQWLDRLEMIMSKDGSGHLQFDHVQIGVARYMQESGKGKGPKNGAVMVPGHLPDVLVGALSGRPLGTLIDFIPLRDTPITEAHNVTIAARLFTVIGVEPVREEIEAPSFLLQ